MSGAAVHDHVPVASSQMRLGRAKVSVGWASAGKMDPVDPIHLFILLWGTTQYYADFDVLAKSHLQTARLGERWGTGHRVPESMIATMVVVPLPQKLGATFDDACRLRDALLFEDGVEVNVSARAGRLWVRVAIQIYNEPADVARLARAVEKRAR